MLGWAGQSNGADLHSDGMLWLGEAKDNNAAPSSGKAMMSEAVTVMRAAAGKKREAEA